MKTEISLQSFCKKGFFWCLFHKEKVQKKIEEIQFEIHRLQVENDGLVDYNKRLENAIRLKEIELKKTKKELGKK